MEINLVSWSLFGGFSIFGTAIGIYRKSKNVSPGNDVQAQATSTSPESTAEALMLARLDEWKEGNIHREEVPYKCVKITHYHGDTRYIILCAIDNFQRPCGLSRQILNELGNDLTDKAKIFEFHLAESSVFPEITDLSGVPDFLDQGKSGYKEAANAINDFIMNKGLNSNFSNDGDVQNLLGYFDGRANEIRDKLSAAVLDKQKIHKISRGDWYPGRSAARR